MVYDPYILQDVQKDEEKRRKDNLNRLSKLVGTSIPEWGNPDTLAQGMVSDPDKFYNAVRGAGRNPDTDGLLKSFGATQQELDELYGLPPSFFSEVGQTTPQKPVQPTKEPQIGQLATGEFGGEEFMPLTPWAVGIMAKQQADEKAFRDAMQRLYPDSDLQSIAEFAATNTQDFLNTLLESGRNEESDRILKALYPAATSDLLDEFWNPPQPIMGTPNNNEIILGNMMNLDTKEVIPIDEYRARFPGQSRNSLATDRWVLAPETAKKLPDVIKVFGEGLTKLPKNIAASVLQALQGESGASVVNPDWADKFIADNTRDQERFVQEVADKYGKSGLPINPTDLAQLPSNMAFSITSMGAGLAVGAPIALLPLPGARVAAWVAGTAASGAVAYGMASYQIMQQYLEAKNDESIAKTGKGITQDEENRLKADFQGKAIQYGLWEAIPEALSNLAFAKILTAPLGRVVGKSIATKIVGKMAGMYGEEFLTETITQKGQSAIEVSAGLRENKISWWQAFKEIAPQTFLLTTIMGGVGGGVVNSVSKIKESLKKEIGESNPVYEQIVKELSTANIFRELTTAVPPSLEAQQGAVSELELPESELIKLVNETSRNTGAVGLKAITPKYVELTSNKNESILDFGAGKSAVGAHELQEKGFNVTAYDIGKNVIQGVHDIDALSKTYDTVYASNVLNVAPTENFLAKTLSEIAGSVNESGRAVFNYPTSPRKLSLTTSELISIIRQYFSEVNIVAGTKSAPILEAKQPLIPSVRAVKIPRAELGAEEVAPVSKPTTPQAAKPTPKVSPESAKPSPVETVKPQPTPETKPVEKPAVVPAPSAKTKPTVEAVEAKPAEVPPIRPPKKKVRESISYEEEKPGLGEKVKDAKQKAIVQWIDRLYPIDKFVSEAKKTGIELAIEEDPYKNARLLEGVTSKATNFIENGTFGRRFWKIVKGKAVPNYTGEGLSQILEPVKDTESWKDFSTYLTSLHAVELERLGYETGMDITDANREITEMEGKYRNFPELSSKIQKYQKALLDYIQESGLIDQSLRDKLDAKYYAYVPFYRVMDELQAGGYMGKKMVDISKPIKRMKGSERDVINPLESIVKNTYAMISAADRNHVGVSMARIAHDVPEVAPMFKHIKTPISRVAQVTAKELGIEITGLSEQETEAVFNIFRPSMFKAENVATVMIDGGKQFFEVDPDLNKALHSIDETSMGILWKVLSAPAKWLRAGATLSPDFMVRNPARDMLTAFVYSKYGFIPGIDFMKGAASVINKGKEYQLYRMSGGEHSMLVSLDRDYLQSSFKEIVEGKKFNDYVKHPLKLLQIASELGEKATRLGEFKKGIAQGANPLEAGLASREVTLDFAKAGTQAKAVNQIIAFFNANIRGWDRMFSAFREKPVQTSTKIFMGVTLPSIILYMINRDDDRWKEIPRWQKDLFWIILTKDNIYRIPKPFELGLLFGSSVERFLEYMDNKDPEIFKELGNSIWEAGTPGWLPTGLIPIIENIANHSFFRGTPIVSEGKSALPPEFQYTNYTSETAKGLGKLINQSPAKIDNIIQGWTGGLGRYATQVIDKLLQGTGIVPDKIEPSKTLADIPAVKAFVVRNPIGGSSESVNKFYDALDKYTAQEKRLKLLLEDGSPDYEAEKAKHPELLIAFDDSTNTIYSATRRYLTQVSAEMSDIRKLQDKIYKSADMTPEKKRELIEGLDKIKTDLSQKALALLENPNKATGILETPAEELENRLGEVINPVPPISTEKPDYYGMPELAKDLNQVEGNTKLSDLLSKNNKIMTDIANLPDAPLYKIDRTVDVPGLTRRQRELLDQYDASDNQPQFIKEHPGLELNPKQDWLKKNPESNAILAMWGNAKILTQEAYDIAQKLIESHDVPTNAFPEGTMPPADIAKPFFEYNDALEFGANGYEARLIGAQNPKLFEWLGREPEPSTNANIKYLESKIANRDLQEQRDALKDTYDDNVKDEKGLTELDRVRMKFDKSNPDYLKNDRLAEAYSFGADEAIANKWLEHGDVSDEFGSNTAEMKTWYLDNPGMHEWAVAHGKTEDDGLDWNEPVLRIKVKNRDLQEQYDALGDDDARLQFRKDNPEYTDDLARIKAYENDGEAFVDKVVEWNRISRDMPGQNAEEKVFWADNPDAYRWAVEHELIKDNMENWNIPALRLDAQWRDKDAEYQAILDKYGNSESKEQREATDAFWANPENKNFQVAWYSRDGYKLGLTDDVTISKYVEFNQLPTYGKWRDRYKLENLGFFESVRALQSKKDRWEDLKPEEIPAIQYDQIYEDFKPQFKEYEESTEAEKKVMLEKYPKFRMARIRREGYSLQFPEKHIERYVEYMEIPKKGYADERYLKAHQDFYAEIFKRKGWTEAIDFALVPTEKVENDYNVYQKITSTSARNLFLVEHRELETWLIAKKLRTRPVSGTGKIQTESGAVKLARSWAGADKVRDIMQGRLVR